MKLVIQIPCHNEGAQLPETLAALPRAVPGFDIVELLVIDDGSTDGTAELAMQLGADDVVRLPQRQGLARAFSAGLEAALRRGADVIVNTDGDNQYEARDLPALSAAVLAGADLAIGDRQVATLAHFSPLKRLLQRVGSGVVRGLSGVEVADATSGFRALSREAALRLVVLSPFTYTLETLMQAGAAGMVVANVPVRTNPPRRPSRLFRSIPSYLRNSAATLLRASIWYSPLRSFLVPAALLGAVAMVLGGRFLYFYLTQTQSGHVQSVVVAGVCVVAAFVLSVAGVLADAVRINRLLLMELLVRARRAELAPPPDEKRLGSR